MSPSPESIMDVSEDDEQQAWDEDFSEGDVGFDNEYVKPPSSKLKFLRAFSQQHGVIKKIPFIKPGTSLYSFRINLYSIIF